MPVKPKPHVRRAREVRHFVDGYAQIAVGKVEAGGSGGALVSGNVEPRQVWSRGQKRLQDSTGNVAARGDPEDVLIREGDDGITLCAVLLQIADASGEHLRERCWIAAATELAKAARTFGQRMSHLRQAVTEARRLKHRSRLAKEDRASKRNQRGDRRDSRGTKREQDRAGEEHHGVHGKDNVLRIGAYKTGLHGSKGNREGAEQKSRAGRDAGLAVARCETA